MVGAAGAIGPHGSPKLSHAGDHGVLPCGAKFRAQGRYSPRQFRKDTGEPSGFAPLPGMRVSAAEVKGCDLRAFRNPQQLGHALEGLLDGVAFGRHRIDLRHFSDAQPLSKGGRQRRVAFQHFQNLRLERRLGCKLWFRLPVEVASCALQDEEGFATHRKPFAACGLKGAVEPPGFEGVGPGRTFFQHDLRIEVRAIAVALSNGVKEQRRSGTARGMIPPI